MDAESTLVSAAVLGCAAFCLTAIALRGRPKWITPLVPVYGLTALCVFAFRIHQPLSKIPQILFRMVYDGSDRRACLLLYWSMCTLASLIFCVVVSAGGVSSTLHRKFFHFTVSLICYTGIKYDPEFTWLAAYIVLCIFVAFEALRALDVSPWALYLNDWQLVFIDSQDSRGLILTPCWLLVGIFLPLFLSPIYNYEARHLYHYAGILSVGVGDTAAAVVGTFYGVHRWPNSLKTLEGTSAMIGAQFVVGAILCGLQPPCTLKPYASVRLLFASFACAFVEALLKKFDNVVLPLLAYSLLCCGLREGALFCI